jgi:hypothetical protein
MDGRLTALERRAQAEPGDVALQLELATAYGRAGEARRAYRGFMAAGVEPPHEILVGLGAEQHLLLRSLGSVNAQVASDRAQWGWSWRDLPGFLRGEPAGPVAALNLSWQRLTPAQLQRVAALITLQHLGLSGVPFDLGQRLRLLGPLRGLEVLDLSYTGLRDDQLPALGAYERLRILNLASCSELVGSSLGALTKAPLVELDLRLTAADDGTLEVLAGFPCLRRLCLLDCQRVSDRGLELLSLAPTLESLDLSFCQGVSRAGVEALVERRPQLKVSR